MTPPTQYKVLAMEYRTIGMSWYRHSLSSQAKTTTSILIMHNTCKHSHDVAKLYFIPAKYTRILYNQSLVGLKVVQLNWRRLQVSGIISCLAKQLALKCKWRWLLDIWDEIWAGKCTFTPSQWYEYHLTRQSLFKTKGPKTYRLPHSNHVTSSKRMDTLICHTTSRNAINFLYNPGHVTFWCLEEVPFDLCYSGKLWDI